MKLALIVQEWCHTEGSEVDFPTTDVEIKQLKNTIDQLQSELEIKSREIVKLRNDKIVLINKCIQLKKNGAPNKNDLENFSQSAIHDDSLKEKEGSNKEDSLRLRDDNKAVTTINQKEKDDLKHSKPDSLEDEQEKDSDSLIWSTVPKSPEVASVSYLLWNTKIY